MAQTRTRTRAAEDEELKAKATASDDDDDDEDDDEEESAPVKAAAAPARGRVQSVAPDDDDDDDLDDDDDDDDSIIIGEGWEEAEAPTGVFPSVDRGEYTILLSDTEVRKAGDNAKNPGAKYGVLVFKIRAEDNEDKMSEEDGTVTIWHSLFFTSKSYGRTKKFVSGMGIVVAQGDNIMEPLQEAADEEALFTAIVGVEKYKQEDEDTGKMVVRQRNKILRITGRAD